MMRNRSLIVLAGVATSLLAASPARADVRGDVEEAMHADMVMLNTNQVDALAEYSHCRKVLATARKKLKPTDKLRSGQFKPHPKAVEEAGTFVITVADLAWICDTVEQTIARKGLWTALDSARGFRDQLATSPAPEARAKLGDGAYYLTQAKACVTGVAGAEAAGTKAIEWQGQSIPTADARELCDVLRTWGEYLERSGAANFDVQAAKYRELGVGGDRLRLFVEYDDVSFRGKRCEIIDDTAALVRAKYVYQWLENADGTHTIRKYVFTGDRYKVSEKTFLWEKQAYAYCK
jgi:hypothetical protein